MWQERRKGGRGRVIFGGIFAAAMAIICIFCCCASWLWKDSDLVRSRLELGERYLLEQDYRQAQFAFAQAIQIDSRNVESYLGHGLASGALGDAEALQRDYEMLLALEPERTAVIETWRAAAENGVLLGYVYTSNTLDNYTTRYFYNLYGQRLTETTEYASDDSQDKLVRYRYDLSGRMIGMTVYQGIDDPIELHHMDYTYDEAGHISQVVCTKADGTVSYTTTYAYNDSGLLTRMESTGNSAFVRSYRFDSAGNCVEEIFEGQVYHTSDQTYRAATIVSQYTYVDGAVQCGFRLDSFGKIREPLYLLTEKNSQDTIGYTVRTCDAAGNCLTRSMDEEKDVRTYDTFGRLVFRRVTSGGGVFDDMFEYTYGNPGQALAGE